MKRIPIITEVLFIYIFYVHFLVCLFDIYRIIDLDKELVWNKHCPLGFKLQTQATVDSCSYWENICN